MKHIKSTALAAALMVGAAGANAATLNFISLTESPTGLGESAWTTLSLNVGGVNMSITGHASSDTDGQQYAYLDWGTAGLGVCQDAWGTNVANPGSGSNRCSPSSDDNVTRYEYLLFSFDKDVVIDNLWFNNNHDGGFGQGDQVNIGGTAYNVATGYAGGANGIGSFTLKAGEKLKVGYENEEFYVSGIEVHAVPVPGTLGLLGLGLAGLGLVRRRSAA